MSSHTVDTYPAGQVLFRRGLPQLPCSTQPPRPLKQHNNPLGSRLHPRSRLQRMLPGPCLQTAFSGIGSVTFPTSFNSVYPGTSELSSVVAVLQPRAERAIQRAIQRGLRVAGPYIAPHKIRAPGPLGPSRWPTTKKCPF